MLTVEKSDAAFVPAGMAAGSAAAASVVLQLSALAAAAPEGVQEALWVLGWVLAAWAVVSMISAVVLLIRRRDQPMSSALASIVLVGASAVLLAIVAWLHPFIGIGMGTGGGTA